MGGYIVRSVTEDMYFPDAVESATGPDPCILAHNPRYRKGPDVCFDNNIDVSLTQARRVTSLPNLKKDIYKTFICMIYVSFFLVDLLITVHSYYQFPGLCEPLRHLLILLLHFFLYCIPVNILFTFVPTFLLLSSHFSLFSFSVSFTVDLLSCASFSSATLASSSSIFILMFLFCVWLLVLCLFVLWYDIKLLKPKITKSSNFVK